jgi:hypothetical protein
MSITGEIEQAVRRLTETSGDASANTSMELKIHGRLAVRDRTYQHVRRPKQLAAMDHEALWTIPVALAVRDWLSSWTGHDDIVSFEHAHAVNVARKINEVPR